MSEKTLVDFIKEKVHDKRDLHHIITQRHYIPDLQASCLTMEYLKECLKPQPAHYCFPVNQVIRRSYRFKGKGKTFLLSYLEKLLKTKKPTGFLLNCPPPLQWLKDVILFIEPDDKLGLLGDKFVPFSQTVSAANEKEIFELSAE